MKKLVIILVVLVILGGGYWGYNQTKTIGPNSAISTKETMEVESSPIIYREGNNVVFGVAEINPNKTVEDSPACTVIENDLQYPMLQENNIEVTRLQDFLRREGDFPIPSTGYFGKITQTAVKSFQKKVGLTETGVVDLVTREKIKNLSCVVSGNERYLEKIKFLSPSVDQVLQRGQGIMFRWTSGFIASLAENRNQKYDIHIVDKATKNNYLLFSNVTRAGYYWQAGYKGHFNADGYSDGKYAIKVCLTGTNTCAISDYTFTLTSEKPTQVACFELPCFYDGKYSEGILGASDSPPDNTTAGYPYQFNVPVSMFVKLVMKTGMSTPGGLIGTENSNTLVVKVDGQEVFRDTLTVLITGKYKNGDYRDKIDEIDLGVLSKGPHSLEIFTTRGSYLSLDWFRLLPMSPQERYLDS